MLTDAEFNECFKNTWLYLKYVLIGMGAAVVLPVVLPLVLFGILGWLTTRLIRSLRDCK